MCAYTRARVRAYSSTSPFVISTGARSAEWRNPGTQCPTKAVDRAMQLDFSTALEMTALAGRPQHAVRFLRAPRRAGARRGAAEIWRFCGKIWGQNMPLVAAYYRMYGNFNEVRPWRGGTLLYRGCYPCR